MTQDPTREELIARAKPGHDAVCSCDPRYLMSCQKMVTAILALAKKPAEPAPTRRELIARMTDASIDAGTYDLVVPADPTPDRELAGIIHDAAVRGIHEYAVRQGWAYPDAPTDQHIHQATAVMNELLPALAETGRVLPPATETKIECDINWTDLRSSRPGAQVCGSGSYLWAEAQFEELLANEIRNAEKSHRVPVGIRRRKVSTYPGGRTLIDAWEKVAHV